MDETSTPQLKRLCAFARAWGFVITATRNGKHNEHSVHPLGLAIDVSVKNKTPLQVLAFKAAARMNGFRVRDERRHPTGQAVWSGPHLHLEDRRTA